MKDIKASILTDNDPFGADTVDIARCFTTTDIRRFISRALSQKGLELPESKNGLILIKPNLNNDLNALTGNSTDLRILATLIERLKDNGYGNIVVGDGSNVGVDRRGIDVFRRLRIDALSQHYGIRFRNLNQDRFREVNISGQKINIARTALDADFFINLPKIKTHAEAMISLCLKNMIGCVVGQDKRKVHRDLPGNIVQLNEVLAPDLHIVDGLIAMEGNGPGDGRPIRLNLMISGNNPFLTDLLCARLTGIDWQDVGALRISKEKGYLTDEHIRKVMRIIPVFSRLDRPPSRHILARLADSRGLYPLKRLLRPVTAMPLVARVAYGLNIIQDVYDTMDDDIRNIIRKKERCRDCGKCAEYCPMGIEKERIGMIPSSPRCIQCLYCYFVCPEGAIELDGTPGFLSRIMDRYTDDIRRAVLDGNIRGSSESNFKEQKRT